MTTSEFTNNLHTASRQVEQPAKPGRMLRPVLWLLVALCGAANVVTKSMDLNPFVGVGFGVLTVSFGVALGVHHYRHRRSVVR
jgi:hypothetical protein